MPINYSFYPKGKPTLPPHLQVVVNVFNKHLSSINSTTVNKRPNMLSSNKVLAILTKDLRSNGYRIETSKKAGNRITFHVPLGKAIKRFDVDGCFPDPQPGKGIKDSDMDKLFTCTGIRPHTILEVEAGRGVANNQFLKDLFEASVIDGIDYLIIAVRNEYIPSKKSKTVSHDYAIVKDYLDALYQSRMKNKMPLKGILLIGY
jgi:hypothetical protein